MCTVVLEMQRMATPMPRDWRKGRAFRCFGEGMLKAVAPGKVGFSADCWLPLWEKD